jgi:hypothetical protein
MSSDPEGQRVHSPHADTIERNLKAFQKLRYSPDAQPLYDMLSGGLIWQDELPEELPFKDIGLLRSLWRFRIVRLIPGAELHERYWAVMKADWEAMRAKCPMWPGFHLSRCETPEVLELFNRLKEESERHGLPDS